MSSERAVKAKIRAAVKGRCYIQSMSSYATNGTPDLWLSGPAGDLWLEVKYDYKTKGAVCPKLSALQEQWLKGRAAEGRCVLVYVARSLNEGVIFRGTDFAPSNKTVDFRYFIAAVLSRTGSFSCQE